MRLLYWTTLFLPDVGGMETLAAGLLPRLRALGHEIVVVASHGEHRLPDVTDFHGIPVHRFHFRSQVQARDLKRLARIQQEVADLKRSFQPDVVHLHSAPDPSAYFHLNTTRAHASRSLMTVHQKCSTFGVTGRQDTLMGKLLRQADWVSAVAAMILEELRTFVPEIRERSSVIHNGLEASTLPVTPLPFDPPRILVLGRLVPYKGVDLALEAFAEVARRFPRAKLSIAGEGAERARLEQQATALRLTGNVEFMGLVDPEKVSELLNGATLLLMPSRTEGFPMTALEAMQRGRPIVATSVGGVPEAVMDGRTGLLVPPEDSQALASALLSLLDHPHTAKDMGEAGRLRQQAFFNLDNTARSYAALYHQLAHQTG